MAKGFKVQVKDPLEHATLSELEDIINRGMMELHNSPDHNSAQAIAIRESINAAKSKLDAIVERAKNKLKNKVIAFCLPGRTITYAFMKNFMQLCFDLAANGTGFTIQQDYSSMVNFARCKCLGYNVTRGKYQLPWDGQLQYDYQMWIDSDIIFNSMRFWKLVDTAILDEEKEDNVTPEEFPLCQKTEEELDEIGRWELDVRRERIRRLSLKCNPITSGYYATEDRVNTPVAHWIYDANEFIANGGMMNFETLESMAARRKPFTADYVGFGWVMVAKGVFENMIYPVFGPKLQKYDNGIEDYCGEDVGFCLDAKELGIPILVDPQVRVGHEKTIVL